MLMIAGVHLLGLACVAVLMIPALRDGPDSPPRPSDGGSDDGWGNYPRRPTEPSRRPRRWSTAAGCGARSGPITRPPARSRTGCRRVSAARPESRTAVRSGPARGTPSHSVRGVEGTGSERTWAVRVALDPGRARAARSAMRCSTSPARRTRTHCTIGKRRARPPGHSRGAGAARQREPARCLELENREAAGSPQRRDVRRDPRSACRALITARDLCHDAGLVSARLGLDDVGDRRSLGAVDAPRTRQQRADGKEQQDPEGDQDEVGAAHRLPTLARGAGAGARPLRSR